MTKVNPSMRLKVKRDTYFLPDPDGNVYFRNNVGSYRMEGSGIDQWIDQLLPVFNGEHTLEDLTDDLPDEYRNRVFEIAESLYQNGFVQDVSQELPHQLTDKILNQYASQIEFLNNFADSGAYRFQSYRQLNVLAVGSGTFFVSLVAALLDSGLAKFHMLITDSEPTNRQRLEELIEHAHKMDDEVSVEELHVLKDRAEFWREAVEPFDSILYVSQGGNVEELRAIHAVCKDEGKVFLPAVFLQQTGVAGPLVHPDSDVCWESALHRIHQSALSKDPQLHTFSTTAGAMLANVIVFELFKYVTAVTKTEVHNHVYLLDLETLEGSWNSFLSHPLVKEQTEIQWVENLDQLLEQKSSESETNGLFPYFSSLTSSKTGIFHVWDESDLRQLPLSQCCVQAVEPLSEGPAELLPEMICTGMTHEEARKEAGLAGLEAYLSRLVDVYTTMLSTGKEAGIRMVESREFVGVGVGETVAEAVSRGLQKSLSEEFCRQQTDQEPQVVQVQCIVEDKVCQYYLQALTTMQGAPRIALGENVHGIPVVWIGTNDCWYGNVGLNVTLALRSSLQQALLEAQNKAEFDTRQVLKVSSVLLKDNEHLSLVIPACEEAEQTDVLQSALQILQQNHKQILLFNLAIEPFLKEELAGVYGVLLREEVFE